MTYEQNKGGYLMPIRNWALFQEVDLANTFFKRFIGWMGKKNIKQEEGLLLIPCRSVHTCFMKFPIDVLFLDASGKVIHMIENMKPWRVSPIVNGSAAVLEVSGGAAASSGIQLGDRIIELSSLK
jgi:uncharacterized membrane protein (UPF0127 family)